MVQIKNVLCLLTGFYLRQRWLSDSVCNVEIISTGNRFGKVLALSINVFVLFVL